MKLKPKNPKEVLEIKQSLNHRTKDLNVSVVVVSRTDRKIYNTAVVWFAGQIYPEAIISDIANLEWCTDDCKIQGHVTFMKETKAITKFWNMSSAIREGKLQFKHLKQFKDTIQ